MTTFPKITDFSGLTPSVFNQCRQALSEGIRDETPNKNTPPAPNVPSDFYKNKYNDDVAAADGNLDKWHQLAIVGDASVVAKWNPWSPLRQQISDLHTTGVSVRTTASDVPKNWSGGQASHRAQDYLNLTSDVLQRFLSTDPKNEFGIDVSAYKVAYYSQALRNATLSYKFDLYNLAKRAHAGIEKTDKGNSAGDDLKIAGILIGGFVAVLTAAIPVIGEAEVTGLAVAGGILESISALSETTVNLAQANKHQPTHDPYYGATPQEIMELLVSASQDAHTQYTNICNSLKNQMTQTNNDIQTALKNDLPRPRQS